MTALLWPDWIAPNSIEFWLENQSRSGGISILGNERIVASPSSRWRASLSFRIWGTRLDPNRLLYWRTFASRMQGRSGSVLIGPWDQLTPGRLAGGLPATAPFSDGATFSDGSLFAQDGMAGIALATAAGAINARTITFTYSGVTPPTAGQYFGLGGTSLYLADTFTNNGDGTFTLGFSPGLRAAVAIGDRIEFERPRCTMRLMADDTARAKLQIGFVADTTLDLVEVF